MKIFMLWHGGSSYAVGEFKDIEEFPSLQAAKDSFESRLRDPYYPCVSDETQENGGQSAWLWFDEKPLDNGDLYPDAVMSHGPKGGVKVTPA